MNEHGDVVWRACVAYVPAHDAEDVLQNTFLKYAMHEQAFSSAEHEKAWLLRVARKTSRSKAGSRRTTTTCSAFKTIRLKPKSVLNAYLKP